MEFSEIKLPPYVFSVVNDLKLRKRQLGEDIIDFGMGNPDGPTPQHIVDKLIEKSKLPQLHRYSASKGIKGLRRSIVRWYKERYDVSFDYDSEAIVTIGSKEGLSHFALASTQKGDRVLVTSPSYPIHTYAFIIAGAQVDELPMPEGDNNNFFDALEADIQNKTPKAKFLLLNFPNNPTAACVDLEFFTRVVAFAKKHQIWVIQDLAYADIVFDDYVAPSIFQVEGAREVAVEFFTLSKSYNMPGWRVGFMVGNKSLIANLARIKSYLDYGIFSPIQVAAIEALDGDQSCVSEIVATYKERRDLLCNGLKAAGWEVEVPKATMFVWAKIPDAFVEMGSLEFAKKLVQDAKVAVSPGVGFGKSGDQYVRFALVENLQRTKQAIKSIEKMMRGAP